MHSPDSNRRKNKSKPSSKSLTTGYKKFRKESKWIKKHRKLSTNSTPNQILQTNSAFDTTTSIMRIGFLYPKTSVSRSYKNIMTYHSQDTSDSTKLTKLSLEISTGQKCLPVQRALSPHAIPANGTRHFANHQLDFYSHCRYHPKNENKLAWTLLSNCQRQHLEKIQ